MISADGSTATIGYDVDDMELARQLLAESDYAGETAVILNPTDYGTITPLGPVLKSVMEDIGYAVEMPALDWATVTSMFGNTDSYSLATDWYSHWCCGNPVQDHLISGTLDFIIRDEDLINLQLEFVRETDAAQAVRDRGGDPDPERWSEGDIAVAGSVLPDRASHERPQGV